MERPERLLKFAPHVFPGLISSPSLRNGARHWDSSTPFNSPLTRRGDVRLSPVKRVASAVGEGSMAIAFVHKYLQEDAR